MEKRHNYIKPTVFGLLAFCIFASVVATVSKLQAKEPIVLFHDSDGKILCRFSVELAQTPVEQERGLMFRKNLDLKAGMLFIYDNEATRYFWMKNTLIPLDLVFIGATLTVVDVYSGAIPLDEQSIVSRATARYVLEINAGQAAACGIKKGTPARFRNIPR